MPRLAPIVVTLALLTGCSSVCDREQQPHGGDATTPENLIAIVQHLCKNECWSELYDKMSERTRDKYGYVKFRVGFPRITAPGGSQPVAEIVATSTLNLIARSHWGDNFKLAYLTPQGKKDDVSVLLILEKDEAGKDEWHVALQDQIDKKAPFD